MRGTTKRAGGRVGLGGERDLGLPLAGVHRPGVGAGGRGVSAAAVHADEEGAGGAGLRLGVVPAEGGQRHEVLADLEEAGLEGLAGLEFLFDFREGRGQRAERLGGLAVLVGGLPVGDRLFPGGGQGVLGQGGGGGGGCLFRRLPVGGKGEGEEEGQEEEGRAHGGTLPPPGEECNPESFHGRPEHLQESRFLPRDLGRKKKKPARRRSQGGFGRPPRGPRRSEPRSRSSTGWGHPRRFAFLKRRGIPAVGPPPCLKHRSGHIACMGASGRRGEDKPAPGGLAISFCGGREGLTIRGSGGARRSAR